MENIEERLFVTFPNESYPIDVPIKNFIDFEIKSDFNSVVFGYIGQGMNDKIYVSMDKLEYLKLQKYKENLQEC